MGKHQGYVRRIWMINARFQWTIVAYTVGISMLTTLLHFFIERNEGSLPHWVSMALMISFNTAVVIFAMWISHRVAGPLYRMTVSMREAAEGKPARKLYFRRWDYFHDLNKSYNDLVDSLPEERRQKDKKQGGFTIMELMIVVAIVGVMVSLSVATLTQPRDEMQFKQDVASLQDALLSARNAAFTRGQCAYVTMPTPTTIQVVTYTLAFPCTPPFPAADLTLTTPFTHASLSGFTDATGAMGGLMFHPRGGTTSNGPANITLTANMADHRTARLVVYPAIGQVRLE